MVGEKELTTDYFAQKLYEKGWRFVPAKDLGRVSLEEPLILQQLEKSLAQINKELGIGNDEIKAVIQELKLTASSAEGGRKILRFFKYGVGVKFTRDKVVRNVRLFDYQSPQNNDFVVSREVYFKGSRTIPLDIVLFVNGIPITDIEGKNPVSLSVTWEDAHKQIKKNEEIIPEAFKYMQIAAALDVEAKYFPVVPWQKSSPVYEWKEKGLDSFHALAEFFSTEKILDMIRHFLFIREVRGEMTKVMARYMQHRTVNKIYGRVMNNLEGKDEKNKGLIWHWQGSGKTLTMIFAAHKLFFERRMENPTVIFVVDRQDLEEQLSEELNALDLNFRHEVIETREGIADLSAADAYGGRRGVFVSLLHKFEPGRELIPEDILQQNQAQSASKKTIAERKNVVVFLDEVHRSQYGLLAAQMKKYLKSAFFFGFTGTPIAEEERNTYIEFGYPIQEEGYLDRYFIDESQGDGFTVPVIFIPRKEHLHLKQEEFGEIYKKDIGDDALEDLEKKRIESGVAKKLTVIKVFLENQKRIEELCGDIAGHFKEEVDNRFKAMVVCGSRKACVYYKECLDKLLGGSASEIVMTFAGAADEETDRLIQDFYKKWQARYPSFIEDRKIRDEIIRRFEKGENPKILIVTDMLLTGFDAAILQTMYFDKPLKKHRLLQAMARVNRVYQDVKEAGTIIDYIGITREAKKAIAGYYKSAETQEAILDFSSLVKKFETLLEELKRILGSPPRPITRESLADALERIRGEEGERLFLVKYKELRKIFELLGSHEIKVNRLEEFRWFSSIYAYYEKLKAAEDNERKKIEHYFKRTLRIIHDSIDTVGLDRNLPPFAFDNKYLEKLKKSGFSKNEQVMNIVFGLERLVLVEKSSHPAFYSVYDRVQALVRKWRERKVDMEELYDDAAAVMGEVQKKQNEQQELGLSALSYGLYLVLKEYEKKQDSVKSAQELEEGVKEYLLDGWREHAALRQNVSRKVRDFVRRIKMAKGLSLEDMEIFHQKLMGVIERYGEQSS